MEATEQILISALELLPLFVAPQPVITPEWANLTDEEIFDVESKSQISSKLLEKSGNKFTGNKGIVFALCQKLSIINFARAIEAASYAKQLVIAPDLAPKSDATAMLWAHQDEEKPVAPLYRMLTEKELLECAMIRTNLLYAVLVQRKFCEVNGLTISTPQAGEPS